MRLLCLNLRRQTWPEIKVFSGVAMSYVNSFMAGVLEARRGPGSGATFARCMTATCVLAAHIQDRNKGLERVFFFIC